MRISTRFAENKYAFRPDGGPYQPVAMKVSVHIPCLPCARPALMVRPLCACRVRCVYS